MRANKFLLTTVLVSLLSASLMAPVQAVASSEPVTMPDSHEPAIVDAEGAVYGTWARALEEVTLFLDGPVRDDGDGTTSPEPRIGVLPGVSAPAYEGSLILDPPSNQIPRQPTAGAGPVGDPEPTLVANHPDDKRVRMDSLPGSGVVAHFAIPEEMVPTRPYQVYGFEASLYVGCTSNLSGDAPSNGDGEVRVELRYQGLDAEGDPIPGNYRDFDGASNQQDFLSNGAVAANTGTSRVDATDHAVFRGTVSGFESLGAVAVGEGHRGGRGLHDPTQHRLVLEVRYSGPSQHCHLHFGSANFPSHIKIVTDTATVNTWVAESDGDFAPGLPSADRSSQEQRRMIAKVAQASAWPGLNELQIDALDYQSRIFTGNLHAGVSTGADRWNIRWRDLQDNGIEYDTRTGDSDQLNKHIKIIGERDEPRVTRLDDGLNMVEYDFLYTKDLADGRYAFELYSERSLFSTSPSVAVGLKGFHMSLIDSRGADAATTHEVQVKEETTFLLSLRNFGAQADSVRLSTTSPGTGWTVDLDMDKVQLPAAGSDPDDVGVEVPVTVIPSETAKVGDQAKFRITARSSFSEEVADQSLDLKVVVVAQQTPDVDAFGVKQEHSVSPGAKIALSDLRVHNLGSRADTYLVEAQLPLDASGWTSRVVPPSRLISADSVETFGVEINVAHDAPDGLTVEVPVTVRLVGDNTVDGVLDTIVVTVHVILEHELSFTVADPIRAMRTPVETCPVQRVSGYDPTSVHGAVPSCTLDSRHDLTSLYRLRFTNDGPVDEVYSLRGDWEGGSVEDRPVTVRNGNSDCDGVSNAPEFWRVDYGRTRDSVLNNPASGSGSGSPEQLDRITVPAGQTVHRWVEMGYLWPNEIPGLSCNILSEAASYRLVATVENAPGQKVEHRIGAYRVGSPGTHGVQLEPDLDPVTSLPSTDQESELVGSSQLFESVTYRFRVRNTGTQNDAVSVSVNAGSGYTQELKAIDADTPQTDTSCAPLSSISYRCRNLGIYGEAVFELTVTPDAKTKSIGQSIQHTITAVETSDGTSTTLDFTTDLVGEFQFDADTVISGHSAHAGQVIHLPFQVFNQGSRDDTFSISLTDGSADWQPRLSTDDLVFVAGEHNLEGYLRVQVPDTAEVDDSESFQLRVASSDPSKGARLLTFVVTVVADTGMVVQGEGGNPQVLLQGRGLAQTVTVEAVDPASAVGDPITFRVDRAKLPAGWSVTEPFQTGAVTTNVQGHVASVGFEITAPQEAIGTSSVPLIVEACRGTQDDCADNDDFVARGDIIMNLQDDVGVFMRLDDPDVITATLPGGDVVLPVLVQNAGLSADVIDLSSTEAKTGWSISYDPPVLPLAPLESQVVDVIVSTPAGAAPGEKLDFVLFATSRNEASEFAQLQLTASIGVFDLEWSTKQASAGLAPGETHDFVARVHNNGTLPDAVFGTPGLATQAATDAYGDLVDVRLDPSAFELLPGETRDVVVSVRLAPSVPPTVTIPVRALFESIPDAPDGTVEPTFDVRVLDYRAVDVDGDGIVEFAVDRNGNKGDGFEEFLESDASAGTLTQPAQLVRFLSDEGRLRHTVKVTEDNQTFDRVVLRIDGDPGARNFGDGKVDLLLDSTGDGLPDHYWDPDDGHFGRLTVFKDVNADGVPDYFVDTSGNGEFNAVYDLSQGTFMKLLARDVDNDGTPDYVVDKNGNGRVDGDETVLFVRDGKLIQVTKVDVDGDGQLDDVFDTDGDGNPDYFVPNGRTKGVPITVDRDLNEDGFLDWSYDANRDGRDDHYYDPAAQSGGHAIDAQAEFVRSLQQFWYVGALFILVAALFVVLVAVTRR